jgi:hypothetical protein
MGSQGAVRCGLCRVAQGGGGAGRGGGAARVRSWGKKKGVHCAMLQ